MQKKYGGYIPKLIHDDRSTGPRPDLSCIVNALPENVKRRNEVVLSAGYCMKARNSCPLPCCRYLHSEQQQEDAPTQQVVIRRIIKRRPKKKTVAPESTADPNQHAPAAAARKQQHEKEEARVRHQPQLENEAERKRRTEEGVQQQQLKEQKRQGAAASTEADGNRASATEAEKQKAAAPINVSPTQKVVIFQNTGKDPIMAKAELYYESTRWGPLGHGDPPVSVGSFPGHRWFIVANGIYAKLFTVSEEEKQTFAI